MLLSLSAYVYKNFRLTLANSRTAKRTRTYGTKRTVKTAKRTALFFRWYLVVFQLLRPKKEQTLKKNLDCKLNSVKCLLIGTSVKQLHMVYSETVQCFFGCETGKRPEQILNNVRHQQQKSAVRFAAFFVRLDPNVRVRFLVRFSVFTLKTSGSTTC